MDLDEPGNVGGTDSSISGPSSDSDMTATPAMIPTIAEPTTPQSAMSRPPAATGSTPMSLFLYAVFILSGAAGLIYESIWSRYLGLFVGHSAYAQIIVLVIFLGGMAMGAMLAGRHSERLRQPLLWYAGVEVVVGLLGLVFHDVFEIVTALAYDAIFPAFAGSALLLSIKWGIAALLIFPQSVLLGSTFPLMSAGALRALGQTHLAGGTSGASSGRVLALLYFANSLGAAVGVLAAGFWLIRIAGLPGTLLAAALINILVGGLVFAVVRLQESAEEDQQAPVLARPEPSVLPIAPASRMGMPGLPLQRLWNLLLAVSFGTALASFIYEIAWIRMLSFVLGSATHAFELMLSAFILGLALGAFWIRARIDRLPHPMRTLGIVQVAMGLLAIATLPVYLGAFEWTAVLLETLRPTDGGYRAFNLARYGLSLAVMLPSTFCAGMTLPLITAMLLRSGTGEQAIGTVYGVNTFGSIVGVTLGALVLMPVLGLKHLLFAGAALDIAIGIALLAVWVRSTRPADDDVAFGYEDVRERLWRSAPVAAAAASVLLLGGFAVATRFDTSVLTSGVYRFGAVPEPGSYDIVFYEDGRTATVSVRTSTTAGGLHLATNGKPDASLTPEWFERDSVLVRFPLRGDASTQLLLGAISLAHAPAARTAAVIGLGSGMTSHVLLADPDLERVTTIEIEPEMVAGARFFHPVNERVFEDPRSFVVIDDAKSYFAAGQERYDLIISEPSNPWVSGVSGLFTTEFYARVKEYLADGGIFGQWLHLYEIDDGLVLAVFAALHEHFPSYEVYMVANADLLIVASNAPTLSAPAWSILDLPGIEADLRHVVPVTPDHMEALRLFSRSTLDPLLSSWGSANSDFYPVLDLGTERTRFQRVQAQGFTGLQNRRFDPVAALEARRIGDVGEPLAPIIGLPRLTGLAHAARLRLAAAGPDTLIADSQYEEVRFQVGQFEASLRAGRTPTSWRHWIRELLAVESRVHGGMTGVVDDGFYRDVFAYLERVRAPEDVVTAVRFMRALGTWDWAAAVTHGDALADTRIWREVWLPISYARDGLVTAKLMTGDIAGARERFDGLVSGSRDDDALVAMILRAHITRAEWQAGLSAPVASR